MYYPVAMAKFIAFEENSIFVYMEIICNSNYHITRAPSQMSVTLSLQTGDAEGLLL